MRAYDVVRMRRYSEAYSRVSRLSAAVLVSLALRSSTAGSSSGGGSGADVVRAIVEFLPLDRAAASVCLGKRADAFRRLRRFIGDGQLRTDCEEEHWLCPLAGFGNRRRSGADALRDYRLGDLLRARAYNPYNTAVHVRPPTLNVAWLALFAFSRSQSSSYVDVWQ